MINMKSIYSNYITKCVTLSHRISYGDTLDQAAQATGDTLYEIWYGEEDHAHDPTPSLFANGKLAWLAVPRGATVEGEGTIVALNGTQGQRPLISGRPTTGSRYYIGDTPNGPLFVSAYTVIEDGTTNLWYEINYNHREAWVSASEVTVVQPKI
jgi:hypothetical protein